MFFFAAYSMCFPTIEPLLRIMASANDVNEKILRLLGTNGGKTQGLENVKLK